MNQTWFIQGKVFGPASASHYFKYAELRPPCSYAYFCPVCGEVWARRVITPPTLFHSLSCHCPRHPEGDFWDNVPGSVVRNYLFAELWTELPLELKKREALLFIDATLRNLT